MKHDLLNLTVKVINEINKYTFLFYIKQLFYLKTGTVVQRLIERIDNVTSIQLIV